jgi:hypothetical protein
MKPLLIQNKAAWHTIMQDALARTDQIAKLDPSWGLAQVVRRQLEFMQQCVEGGRAPTQDAMDRVDVGPIAARNLEESDPEYANWLEELWYAFRNWERLP